MNHQVNLLVKMLKQVDCILINLFFKFYDNKYCKNNQIFSCRQLNKDNQTTCNGLAHVKRDW